LSDGNFRLSTRPVPHKRGRIVITLGWRFFAKVGKDDEPIFDSFIRRGNVAASAMSGISRAKCLVNHSQTLFHTAQKLRSALHR
jgi:hypothetical protein